MRRLRAWGLSIAFFFSAGAAWAGDTGSDVPAGAAQTGGSWLSRWWNPGRKAPDKPPEPVAQPQTPAKPAPGAMAPNPMDEAAAQRKVEEGKYLRRLEVCDKLHDIAEAANDSALQRRADELQNRAFEIYKQRTAHCPASRAVFESDRKTLEKHLGSGAPVPATPAGSALITVTGKEGRSTAQEDMR